MKNQNPCLPDIITTHLHVGIAPKISVARRFVRMAFALAILSTLNLHLSPCFAQDTAFTYQGRLNDGANSANGIYDLRFTLHDAASGGNQQGDALTNSAVGISNGVFTVTLNFGDQFPGADRWLEIGVRTNGGGAFTTLTPRQAVTATPYAITAGNLSGTIPATQLTGTVPNAQLSASVSLLGASIDSAEITDGAIATNDLNASVLNGTFWKLGGNTDANPTNGIFLGTMDNQPLEFKVNNQRALRLQPSPTTGNPIPNLIGGHPDNTIDAALYGSVIAGGGGPGAFRNAITNFGYLAAIVGGYNNIASEQDTFIGGGFGNRATGRIAVIGGGRENLASGLSSFIGGGYNNNSSGTNATVTGGSHNTASGTSATIGGGQENIAGNLFATVSGGDLNNASGDTSTIGGGQGNVANNTFATVSGGSANNASGISAMVPGGFLNSASGDYSFAAGHRAKANHSGAFVWADSQNADFASTSSNQFLIRASGGVAIGTNDPAGAALRVAGSIKADSYLGMGATLTLGTTDNQPLEFKVNNQRGLRLEYADVGFYQGISVIGGYSSNFVAGGVVGATISGGGYAGNSSQVTGDFGAIGGGAHNSAGAYATIGGGGNNSAGTYAAIGGGSFNTASGYAATVPGGSENTASGDYSFAAGNRAKANHSGAFVWADSQNADFASTSSNQFLIRASGGVAIGTNDPAGAALRVAGAVLATSFTGDGGGLTGIARLNAGNTFTGDQSVNGNQNITGSLRVDANGANDGTSFNTASALKFGLAGTGEGIASKRTAGGNQFGLDFYTGYEPRLSIANTGNVGIGTTSPGSGLEVAIANEVGPADGAGIISAGAQNAGHIALDSDDIQKYDNATTVGPLYLNDYGGDVNIGSPSATTTIDGTFVNASDRNLKEDIQPVESADVLAHLMGLPVSTWKYKGAAARRHVGPMAQDFHAAFNELLDLKSDDKTIAPLDEAGVAFVSIQALNGKVDSENAKLREALEEKQTQIAELQARLEKLEKLVSSLTKNQLTKN